VNRSRQWFLYALVGSCAFLGGEPILSPDAAHAVEQAHKAGKTLQMPAEDRYVLTRDELADRIANFRRK
jgi:hypothetical protein